MGAGAFEDLFGRSITMFSNQRVPFVVLAEPIDPRGNHYDRTLVCNRHAGAINGFIAHPGLLVLVRIHPYDDFVRSAIEPEAVNFC